MTVMTTEPEPFEVEDRYDLLADLRAASQTSTGVDAEPAASLVESSAHYGPFWPGAGGRRHDPEGADAMSTDGSPGRVSSRNVADLRRGDLVRLDRNGGWREVGSVQVKYHVRIDGQLYYLDADQMLDVRVDGAE